MSLLPKSVVLKHLRPDSGAKLVSWLADDNAKAVERRKRRQAPRSRAHAAPEEAESAAASARSDGDSA